MTEERDQRVVSENREKDQNKRMQRQIRDIKEEMTELSKKETEASRKKHELVSFRAPLLDGERLSITIVTIIKRICHNAAFYETIKWFL